MSIRISGLFGWFNAHLYQWLIFAAMLLVGQGLSAQPIPPDVPVNSIMPSQLSSQTSTDVPQELADTMTQAGVQIDPLDSPYPIPWGWVLATQAELDANPTSGTRYYRSQSLVSPDGRYAAYSRIQMNAQPQMHKSRVTSVMFLENLQTGDLRTITASSPLADNPLESGEDADMPGTIGILIPVSWSQSSDRLLARQFEGLFGTSWASDYAVVWERQHNRVHTLAPEEVEYSHAVLLGWSQTYPKRVLFRAGQLGDEHWPVWAVGTDGQTHLAYEDQPIVYGELVNQVWAGPQARW